MKLISFWSKYCFFIFARSGSIAFKDKYIDVPMHSEATPMSRINFPDDAFKKVGNNFWIRMFIPIEDNAPKARYVEIFFYMDCL